MSAAILATTLDKHTLHQRIGERIRSVRERKGYKQDELGKLIRQSAVTISRWESAARAPGITDLVELARVLEMPITYFTEDNPQEEPKLVRLLRTAQALNDQDLKELSEYAEFRRQRHVQGLLED